MINRRAFIVGIKSTKLSNKEISFLKKYKPWGIILFTRNIKDIGQTYKLTSSIRKIFKDKKYPILIDQEGGRVNRLKNITSFEISFILAHSLTMSTSSFGRLMPFKIISAFDVIVISL